MESILQEDYNNIIINLGKKNLETLRNKKILITGADGFIGKYLVGFCSYLNSKFNSKIKLVLIIGPNSNRDEFRKMISAKGYVRIFSKDLTKVVKINLNADYIFHLASITSTTIISNNPVQSLKVNILGTMNVLEALKSKHIKRFLYFSSSAIYGIPDIKNIPIPETFNGNVSSILSRSSYAEAKRAAESIVQAYSCQYKLPVNIVRPFHIYGPSMDLAKDNALNYFIGCGLDGKNIVLNSDGQETRSFCYISDAVSLALLVALQGESGGVYNVGNEEAETKIIDLAGLVIESMGKKLSIITNKGEKDNFSKEKLTSNVPDMKKAKNIFGFSPKVGLTEGLKRTIKSYEK